jgi:hypothetical protein
MLRKLCVIAPVLAAAVMLSGPVRAQPPGQPDHPRMRAALHELREARNELKKVRDVWEPGYKDRALQAVNDAIESIRLNLQVKDVDTFVGVERNPDYYQKFKDHPRLRSAVLDLRQARLELESNLANLRDPADRTLRERALDDIDIALGHILVLVRERKR